MLSQKIYTENPGPISVKFTQLGGVVIADQDDVTDIAERARPCQATFAFAHAFYLRRASSKFV